MIMTYERTIAAATAETASKFRLAEALALDIPPRQPGPKNDEPVDVYLAQAQNAIRDNGGEPRSLKTLKDYRLTALWVRTGNGTNFGWVPGTSYTAHNEARAAGISYADFTARPRTVDQIRKDAGKAGTDGSPEAIAAGWTSEQKSGVLAELLQEPATVDRALEGSIEAHSHAREAVDRANIRLHERSPHPQPQPRAEGVQGDLDWMTEELVIYSRARRALLDLIRLVQDAPDGLLAGSADLASGIRAQGAWLSNIGQALAGLAAGQSDEQLWADLLSEGQS